MNHMKSIITISLFILFVQPAFSQANISTNLINQSFTFIPNPSASQAPLPRNWRLAKSNSVRTVNPYPASPASMADTTTQFRGGSLMAANSPAGFYNFGVGDSITASNRAIGFLADADHVRTCNLYFHVKNTGPTAITSFFVEFFTRKFKNGSSSAWFQIQMYYSRDGIHWTDAGADFLMGTSPDANNNGFTVNNTGLFINSGNLNQTVLPNEEFYFAWSYSVVIGIFTANAPAYGIDAINITPNVALPISLVKFEAEKLAEKVKLQWVTASEVNNEKFIIERSSNGKDYEFLSEVRGAGNSKELNTYETVDAKPLKGTSYYRLTQVDFDGTSNAFDPIALNMNQGVLSVEPGAGSQVQGILWTIYTPSDVVADVLVHDLNGRLVYAEKIQLTEGYQSYTMPTLEFDKGMYVMSVVAGKNAIRKKLNIN